MILMDLTEQADRDFGRARRRSWLRRLVSRLRGEPASRRIPPSFDEARRSLRALNRILRGRRAVDPRQIVGSVGRRSEPCLTTPPKSKCVAQMARKVQD